MTKLQTADFIWRARDLSANRCGICSHQNREQLETLGVEALSSKRSWRSAARDGGLNYHQALKVHMVKHYTSESQAALAAVAAGLPDTDVVTALVGRVITKLSERPRPSARQLAAFFGNIGRSLNSFADADRS